jgi:hypothetical protein
LVDPSFVLLLVHKGLKGGLRLNGLGLKQSFGHQVLQLCGSLWVFACKFVELYVALGSYLVDDRHHLRVL